MKKLLTLLAIILAISAVLGFQSSRKSQESNEIFTIYLVRHSEKDVAGNNGGDPPLTTCGEERSEKLSLLLSDVHLDAVYSTNYSRTKNTALPTARSKGLEIQEYSAQDLELFSQLLINRKQDALVVGHSNTTGVLAGMLAGQEIGAFDESIYNRVYQVVIHENNGRLHVLHTAFSCTE